MGGGILIGLVSLIVLSLLSLYLVNNNQVIAAAPSGFNVSVDTAAGAVDYTTGTSDGYLGVRVRLVSPSDFSIKSDLSSLRFTFVKSSEIETKCTNINKDDGSAATSHRPPTRTTSTSANYYHSFGTVTNSNQLRVDRVFVKKDQLTDTEEYKICVEIPYHRSGSSEMMYAYVSTSMEFTEAPPKVTDIMVKSATYTAADIGKNIEVVYTFDRPVRFTETSSGNGYVRKFITLPGLPVKLGRKAAVGSGDWTAVSYWIKPTVSTAYSKTIVFRVELRFNMDASDKTGAVPALNDEHLEKGINVYIARGFGDGGSDGVVNSATDPWVLWDIFDEHGRKAKHDSTTDYIAVDDADINDFKITIDTTPIVTLKQVTGGFDIAHTPEKFKLKTFDTVTAATTNPSESTTEQNTITASWTLLKRTTVPKATDKCETGTGITTVTTGTKAAVKEQMPSTPDDMWYCVHTQDVFTRKVMSSWMKYINDTTGPTISHTVVNNRLTFTVTDTDTGYKANSLRWGALASDRRCVVGFAGELTSTSMAFNINQDLDNQVICVKAEDNSGNLSYKKITLKYNQATTTTDDTDDDEKQEAPKDTSDDDTDKDTDKDQTQTTVDCNNLPDNWNDLTVNEKVRLNPCKCNDTTQIRADNGQCLSGGHSRTTTTIDDDETTTPAPPITGDDEDDEDMMDDEDQIGDDNTVDNDLAEIVLNFNDEDKVLTLTASDGELSNWMYTIIESGQCSPDMDGYQTVDGNTVTVTQDDIDNEKTVCVKADRSDGSTITQQYQLGQTTPSDETTPGDETGDDGDKTSDDEDSSNIGPIIGIVVLVIVIIGVIIFVVNKNKNSNQI